MNYAYFAYAGIVLGLILVAYSFVYQSEVCTKIACPETNPNCNTCSKVSDAATLAAGLIILILSLALLTISMARRSAKRKR